MLDQTATLFVSVLKALNAPEGRMAGKFQLTLLDTLKHSSEADKLPQLHAPPTDDANLLANGEKLLGIAHGALKSEIIGSLGRGVSNKRMAELSGRSVSTVKKAKTSVSRGHTPMLMLKMRPGVKRQKVCGDETVLSPCTTQPTQDCQFRPVNHSRALQASNFWWLYEIACPSRSGDAKLIAWHRGMLHLFYTLYRGGGFVLILEHALEMWPDNYKHLTLENATDRWQRSIVLFRGLSTIE